MSDPTVREATAGDVAALVMLMAEDVRGAGREAPADLAPYRRAFTGIAEDPNQLLLVAEQGGRVVSMAQLTFVQGLDYRGGIRAQIESMRVLATEHGNGRGAAIIEHALREARRPMHWGRLFRGGPRG